MKRSPGEQSEIRVQTPAYRFRSCGLPAELNLIGLVMRAGR